MIFIARDDLPGRGGVKRSKAVRSRQVQESCSRVDRQASGNKVDNHEFSFRTARRDRDSDILLSPLNDVFDNVGYQAVVPVHQEFNAPTVPREVSSEEQVICLTLLPSYGYARLLKTQIRVVQWPPLRLPGLL